MVSLSNILRFLPALLTIVAAGFFIYTLESNRPKPASDRYKECLAQAKDHPEDALQTVKKWQEKYPASAVARHCEAMAFYQLKRYADAAAQLESLAHEGSKDTRDLSVALLIQAAQARKLNNEPLIALQDLDYALTLAPDNKEVKDLQAELTKKP